MAGAHLARQSPEMRCPRGSIRHNSPSTIVSGDSLERPPPRGQPMLVLGAMARIEPHAGGILIARNLKPPNLGSQSSPFGGRTDADGARGRSKERRADTIEIVEIEALRRNG